MEQRCSVVDQLACQRLLSLLTSSHEVSVLLSFSQANILIRNLTVIIDSFEINRLGEWFTADHLTTTKQLVFDFASVRCCRCAGVGAAPSNLVFCCSCAFHFNCKMESLFLRQAFHQNYLAILILNDFLLFHLSIFSNSVYICTILKKKVIFYSHS